MSVCLKTIGFWWLKGLPKIVFLCRSYVSKFKSPVEDSVSAKIKRRQSSAENVLRASVLL